VKLKLNGYLNSPIRIMLALILIICVVETMIMLFVGEIHGLVYPAAEIIIDVVLLVLFIFPAIYKLVVSPLIALIAERRVVEDALRGSTERYRQLIDSVEGIVWEADPSTFSFTFVSQKVEALLGYPVQHWIEEPTFWVDHLHPEDRAWAVDLCVSATRNLQNHVFEYRMISASGSIVWLRDLVTVMSKGGKALSLQGLMVDVTEKKNIELALAASEKRYKFLTDNLRDVIWEMDGDLFFVYASSSVENMFGYRVEELIGKHVGMLLSNDSQQKVNNIIIESLVEKSPNDKETCSVYSEFECIKKDGTVFWGEVNATIFISEGKQIDKVIGCTRDVTDRKKLHYKLASSFDILKSTINSLHEAVIIVAAENNEIEEVNLEAEKMFGYTRGELIGENPVILHLNEIMYRRFGEKLAEAYSSSGYLETAFRMKRRDDSVFDSEHSVVPIIAIDGSYSKHVYVIRDISRRVQIEEELATLLQEIETRNVFVESVLANLKSGIIVVDLDFKITMVNTYVAEICDMAPDTFIGKRLVAICPELHDRMTTRNTDDELAVNFCGSAKVIGFSSFDLVAADTTVIGYIINFRDLSEIITIRREMRKRERLSAMGEVVARVAHEMRNPLFGMTAAAQILEMELALDVSQKQLMNSLLKESRRLNNLVEELLDTTRELRIKKERVNLRKIIDESISITKVMLEQNSISVIKSIPDKEILLSVDADKIEQVMINLIKNAMEACKTGGIVNVAVELCDESAVVKVIDNGSGIPEDILDTIFDVFYTTKRAGTGMGLSISKNIVEAHGGSLAACNNPDGGATFTMTIPWAGGVA